MRQANMFRNVHIWMRSYVKHNLKSLVRRKGSDFHLLFCLVDHFEPLWRQAREETGMERISRWIESYELAVPDYTDSDGRRPRHTYFFPLEQYRGIFLNMLAEHCRKGFGEIEFHLHHDGDTPQNLTNTLEHFKKIFAGHGLLGLDDTNSIRYGFIHGNWALDNAHPQGRFCGINNELTILHDTGCYADFTLPSAPSATQTSTINSIYYAIDDPIRPKSHNAGICLRVGQSEPADKKCLMIVQGPLMLDWNWRLHGIFPRIENGDISGSHPPMKHRLKLWIQSSIAVAGRPDWVFIKVYTHGCADNDYDQLFRKDGFRRLHSYLRELTTENSAIKYHYVTAREMYNIIKAAEAAEIGSPFDFRDYIIKAPYNYAR